MTSPYGPPQGYQPPAQLQPAQPPPAQPNLGVISVILSAVALGTALLIGFIVVLVLIGAEDSDGAEDPDASGSGGGVTVTGQLDAKPTGILTGDALVKELTATLEATGSTVERLQCPDTPTVGQGVVTVCHGSVDYEPWALTVFFETDAGAYTVDFV